ncbi:hypothetical protein Q1695_013277 [Nippostrongylus brasiliensis]|nr:hypothetical protein Q1695_013277 [Nippostrongylus brasiliensis]
MERLLATLHSTWHSVSDFTIPTQGWGASSSAPSTSSSRQLPRPSPSARGRFQPARRVAARPAPRPEPNQPAPVRGERSRPYPRRRGGRQPRSEPRPHPLVDRHPWASLVRLRRLRLAELSPDQVTSDLPADQYRQIPVAGYLSLKFCRSLFPRVAPRNGVVHGTISCVELPSLEDAVLFREAAERLIQDSIAGSLDPLPRPPAEALSPKGIWSPSLIPRPLNDRRPVLYQIVALQANALVLEAKDFFVFLPDHRELHCILLDKFAYNYESTTFGYDRAVVSVRDLVWVYDLYPVASALRSPETTLDLARKARMLALDPQVPFFFRVKTFAFVTPAVTSEPRFAIVLSVAKRRNSVTDVRLAVEDTTEAVNVPYTLIHFDANAIREGDILLARSRRKISCAVRFSEPPASDEARDFLCHQVRLFFPANPSDTLLPMAVHPLSTDDARWLTDRLSNFDNYVKDRTAAVATMSRMFNVAASALAAYATAEDDVQLHQTVAQIPSLLEFPLRLSFVLTNMTTESGWRPHRRVDVWVPDAQILIRTEVATVSPDWTTQRFHITLRAYAWSSGVISRAVHLAGRVLDDDEDTAQLDVYVRLEPTTSSAMPAYAAVSESQLLQTVPEDSEGRRILDAMYGAAELTASKEASQDRPLAALVGDDFSVSFHGRTISLTEDQRQAVALGVSDYPVVGIQAAFGTGKTMIGACVAKLLVQHGHRVIVTASTNVAVAQIAESLLGLDGVQELPLCRYIAETIAFDDSVPLTPVDMHEVLKSFAERYRDALEEHVLAQCRRFRDGRLVMEDHRRNRPEQRLSPLERESLILAERDVSDLVEKMVDIMFSWFNPVILLITTSSLLNDRRGVAEHGSMGSRRLEQAVTPTGGDNERGDLGELVSKERFAFLCGV